jgi:hypothetical protein
MRVLIFACCFARTVRRSRSRVSPDLVRRTGLPHVAWVLVLGLIRPNPSLAPPQCWTILTRPTAPRVVTVKPIVLGAFMPEYGSISAQEL